MTLSLIIVYVAEASLIRNSLDDDPSDFNS